MQPDHLYRIAVNYWEEWDVGEQRGFCNRWSCHHHQHRRYRHEVKKIIIMNPGA